MMQTRLDIVLEGMEADLLTVYDVICSFPPARRPTVCEARYRLRQAVRSGRLRCVGDARDGWGYRIRQYRRA